jgi:hypothetical protein
MINDYIYGVLLKMMLIEINLGSYLLMLLLLFVGYVHVHVLSSDSLNLLLCSHYSWYIRMCSSSLVSTKSYIVLILGKPSKSSQFCHP